MSEPRPRIHSAELVLPCEDLDANLDFFTQRLGFRVDTIIPADDPKAAVLSGHGTRIRLDCMASGQAARLRILVHEVPAGSEELTAPNGCRIELVLADSPIEVPPVQQSFVLTRLGKNAQWSAGRAGMRYRDLIPDRQGGRFIASHIQIPKGGPVPDYVHFHKVRFQAIYCYKGWVKVAYEDQGQPMTLQAGDCFLQPPTIRHRVLECSDGLEVIEIGCPAAHETQADHQLELPTWTHRPDREFEGQRFVHHRSQNAQWQASPLPGFEYRDLGIAEASQGLAGMRVHRNRDAVDLSQLGLENEFHFFFLLSGKLRLQVQGQEASDIQAGDCWVLPSRTDQQLRECSPDVEILEVSLPGNLRETA